MSPGLPPAPSSTPSAAFWGGKKPKSGSRRCGGALSSPRSPLGCPCVLPPQLSEGRDALKKTWNPKFTLRSHYDAVRGLAFHPAEAALLTASEDGTLKLWNLQKTVAAKKWVLGIVGGGLPGGLVSPHPLQVWTCPPFCSFYSFFCVFPPAGTRRWTWSRSTPSAGTGRGRRHPEEIGTPRGELWGPPWPRLTPSCPRRGPVLAVAMGRDSALCCSGGVDACIRRWRLPDLDMDPYDGYGGFPAALPGEGRFWGGVHPSG